MMFRGGHLQCRQHVCTAPDQSWAPLRSRAAAAVPSRLQHARLQSSSTDNDASPQSTFDFAAGSMSSQHSAASISAGVSTSDPDFGYMSEYAALKQQLLDNTRKSGGAIGLYLLFTVNGEAALAAMLGMAASYAYVSWLCRDVDGVKPTDTVPIWEANKIENELLRRAAKVKAAYQAAFSPRLLVPASLGLLIAVYNAVADEPLQLVYSGCLLLGFLSYKAALVVKLVDDLSPKSLSGEPERPVVEKFDDELDQWGRPKKRLANPIDVMPADAQAKAYEQLEQQLAKEARREQQEQQQ